MSSKPYIVETNCHTIEFTSIDAYKAVMEVCEKNNINLDYYFLEFDTQDTEPEAYEEYDDHYEMSDAWDSIAEDV
tara:strand:- start:1348 stop:1572 length:225 start_codon:yes stop_codon:yes gene_type:complete